MYILIYDKLCNVVVLLYNLKLKMKMSLENIKLLLTMFYMYTRSCASEIF